MPAPAEPLLIERSAYEYAKMAAVERHAAKGHHANAAEHTLLHQAAADKVELGAEEHAELAAGHARSQGTHAGAAAAHLALAEVYDRGEAADPRERGLAEQAAGRRVLTLANDKGETIRDPVLEQERHAWLVRRGARVETVRHDDGKEEAIHAIVGCDCYPCVDGREFGKRLVEGRRELAQHNAGRVAAARG